MSRRRAAGLECVAYMRQRLTTVNREFAGGCEITEGVERVIELQTMRKGEIQMGFPRTCGFCILSSDTVLLP
jgi:hypothetical protein